MQRHFITIITILLAAVTSATSETQPEWAIKTNLLYDALLNANAGVELRTSPHWSIDLSGNYNGWKLSHGRQWKHWFVQPEVRYHVDGETMRGHFFAANLIGGQFNTTLKNVRRQGWGAGIGVGYGYSWRFGSHWGLEAELTAGYIRYSYDKYPCAGCGRKIGSRNRNYLGPTKAAINLVYYFGDSKRKEVAAVLPAMPVTEIADTVAAPAATAAPDTMPQFDFILVEAPRSRVLTERISGVARIQFAVNSISLDRNIDNNASELDAIVAKLDSIRDGLDMHIAEIRLMGYASPEGSFSNNDRLASSRTVALREYLLQACNLTDSVISSRHIAEDWSGLREAVTTSELPDKADLLSVIDSDMDADAKEAALKRHRASWKHISAAILPQLRRTEYTIEYEHRYDEKETDALAEVNKAISSGDAATAARLLVDISSSPEADYARGVVAALQQRYDEAHAWLLRAQSRGVEAAADALFQLEAINSQSKQSIQ